MKHTKTQLAEIQLQNEIAHATTYLEFLHANRERLEKLDLKFNFFSNNIDFDNLERPALLGVLKAFPGTWNKAPSWTGDGINYTLATPVNGLTIRCYNGALPPSCVIEERVEWIEVPARVEKKVIRTVKCPDTAPAQTAPAQ